MYIVMLEGTEARSFYGPFNEHEAQKVQTRFNTRAEQLGLDGLVHAETQELKTIVGNLEETVNEHV